MISKDQSISWKFIAIFLVVFGHLGFIPHGGAIGVAVFLWLSGYGLVNSFKIHGLDRYWKKRISTIYIPYVVWALIVSSILVFMNSTVLTSRNLLLILLSILGNPRNVFDPTMWYISYAMLNYLVFYVCYRYFTNKAYRIILVFAMCTLIGADCPKTN